MTTLKCKLCGGNIEIAGESHGICDSCGSEVTLPKIDDDKRADMYNRGNHFRQIGDFDRAYSAYEHIIADNEADAEAHWCLLLCRYGVEYVKDVRAGEYKPTVSRMSYERVLDDPDYLAALRASDEYTKEIYRKEAGRLDRIQSRYLEISRKEPPYDVFICFKAEDENGQRTKGSVLAQDIYEKLTAKGLKVFFSRITLENKLSEEYEPYIFAALHSAKVMLLAADKPEQLEARWVKNEWSRYLKMMEQDRSKHLVPVFTDMSLYDFPSQIPTVQGQDMSRVGAMQDLVRGVCKLTGRRTEPAAVVSVEETMDVKNILIRVRQAIEDGVFDEAQRLTDEGLNWDPENGELYYYGLLAKHEVRELPEPEDAFFFADWSDDRYLSRARQYGSRARVRELEEFEQKCREYSKLSNARERAGKKDYAGAIKGLNEIENTARVEERRLYYEKEVRRYRKEWEKPAAEQTKLEKNLAAYHKQIDPADSYLTRVIRERYPDKTKVYDEQVRNKRKLDKKAGNCKKGKVVLGVIGSVIAVACGIYLLKGLNVVGLIVWSLAFGLGLDSVAGSEFSGSIFMWLLCSLGYFLIFGAITLLIPFWWIRLILPVGALLFLIVNLGTARTAFARDSLAGRTEKFERDFLHPLENEIREQVEKEWEEKIGAGNLKNLPGYQVK